MVSLSGGGVRATLFAFGAFLYLLDSGWSSRLKAVASVSGGSIANAVLAATGDVASRDEGQSIRRSISRGSWVLATHGAFFLPSRSYFLWVALVAAVGGVGMYFVWRDLGGLGIFLSVAYACGFLIYAVVLLWALRRSTQIAMYNRALSFASGSADWLSKGHRNATREYAGRQLKSLPDSSVQHILCATDLVSGQPVYLSREELRSPIFGWGASSLPVGEAIYASAAFPAVFPPQPLPIHDWHGEGSDARRPRRLFLSDGGVYNNLGTDRLVELAGDSSPYTLVVNASKPPRVEGKRAEQFGGYGRALFRVMTVLQENTVRPRIASLQAVHSVAVADISVTPVALAEGLKRHPLAEVANRATEVLDWFGDPQRAGYWSTLARSTAKVPTQLRSVGRDSARFLLQHGYMNAAVSMHCMFGAPFVRDLDDRPERWFAEILADPKAADPAEQSEL